MLDEEQLAGFEYHARTSHLSRDPRPLLSDRVELLVAEVRRLQEGIRAHEAVVRQQQNPILSGEADLQLWSLVT
ncbi:MAG: hypothetical protein LC650_00110 [Actinobacteria bacterium]|nr:hypothetical protein [Actinomycetota bacterium]